MTTTQTQNASALKSSRLAMADRSLRASRTTPHMDVSRERALVDLLASLTTWAGHHGLSFHDALRMAGWQDDG